jgi:murein tripeptide amidase MpaA
LEFLQYLPKEPVIVPQSKPSIVIIGRQHPGKTHASFILHGMVNFLISRDPLADQLRENFEWLIIPMINPDGVLNGNYRSNLQGHDMN